MDYFGIVTVVMFSIIIGQAIYIAVLKQLLESAKQETMKILMDTNEELK